MRGGPMIGTLVRDRRKLLRLSQVALARRAGLSQNYISKLENGEIDLPQRGTLEALGGALGLSLADFYRAAGVLDNGTTRPPVSVAAPQMFHLFDEEESFSEEEMVGYVEARPGRSYQQRVRAQRERLSPERYRRWAIGVFNAFRSNSNLALQSLELGEETWPESTERD